MRRGLVRIAVLGGIAVLLAGIAMLRAAGDLPGWQVVAGLVVPVGFFLGVAFLIAQDSAERGRSSMAWLLACVFLAPVAIPAYLVVAVFDRLRGRRGIESRWAPAGRWYLLAGVLLAVAAGVLAVSPVNVPGMSVHTRTASGSFSGHCSSALSVSLGAGSYDHFAARSAGAPPALTSAQATVANRCSAAAADRMAASAMCLGGAWLLALIGENRNRRRGRPGSARPAEPLPDTATEVM
jgi:hypothetical protein